MSLFDILKGTCDACRKPNCELHPRLCDDLDRYLWRCRKCIEPSEDGLDELDGWSRFTSASYEHAMREEGFNPGMTPTCIVCDVIFVDDDKFAVKVVEFAGAYSAFMFCKDCLRRALDELD